jgi:signal transduction histidine kinase
VFTYISEEVDKLNHIVTGYLSFSRAERRKLEPHPLQKIVSRCLLILEPELEAKSVNLQRSIPDTIITILGDDKRLQQAILNVLLNAVQAVAIGGVIEISLREGNKSAIVAVSDDGVGIAEKHLKEITKPFFTTKDRGSGLGMSIVSAIMKEHGGDLGIESTQGQGTVVTLHIPLAG